MVRKTNKFLFSLIILLLHSGSIFSQQLPNDLSKFRSSQISDTQLLEIYKKFSIEGNNDEEIELEFKKRKMPEYEIFLIKDRLKKIKLSNETNDNGSNNSSNTKSTNEPINKSRKVTFDNALSFPTGGGDLTFGSEFFSSGNTTFEPDLRIATPKNYILGPDDELALEVFGLNILQQNLKVSAEGLVNIKYVGPVSVNGLNIEEATIKIRGRLLKFYPGISNGSTKVQLSLSAIRTIKVSIIGASKKPGTYSIPSVATLFNALYISGGPSESGSYRNIELIRNNKVVVVADFYDYLLKANQKNNVRLEDNDVIRIPYAAIRFSLTGEINRPAIFEMKPTETLADALNFAGGFKSMAYKARIRGTRQLDLDKKIIEIKNQDFSSFLLRDGDSLVVSPIINRFQNRVTITGAVYKPGFYALEDGITLKKLITKSEGLREDAYKKRIIITRTREDLTKEIISVNILASDSTSDILLQREDFIEVASIFEIKDNQIVTINGAVRNPGKFAYEDSLSLKSLILKAGGFSDNATGLGIEISRRKRDAETNVMNGKIVEIIRIDDNKELSGSSNDIKLSPYDIVAVKYDPYYKAQINVSIVGEVLVPGSYSLMSREENISSLIKRAGGLLYTANITGARLKRKKNSNDIDLTVIKKIAESYAKDSSNVIIDDAQKNSNDVAINLTQILANPGGREDIFLQEGDELFIPVVNNMISIEGEVFKPLDIAFTYEKGKSLKEYISDAGGTTLSAQRNKIFVIYANGRAAQTRTKWIFLRKYPQVEPGCKIFVPKKPEKTGFDISKASLVVSTFSLVITSMYFASQIGK
ncbi:MAG: SLBB domain-containing protein [Chitinophagaceae bacterium]